jgi:hypothetical protein
VLRMGAARHSTVQRSLSHTMKAVRFSGGVLALSLPAIECVVVENNSNAPPANPARPFVGHGLGRVDKASNLLGAGSALRISWAEAIGKGQGARMRLHWSN